MATKREDPKDEPTNEVLAMTPESEGGKTIRDGEKVSGELSSLLPETETGGQEGRVSEFELKQADKIVDRAVGENDEHVMLVNKEGFLYWMKMTKETMMDESIPVTIRILAVTMLWAAYGFAALGTAAHGWDKRTNEKLAAKEVIERYRKSLEE